MFAGRIPFKKITCSRALDFLFAGRTLPIPDLNTAFFAEKCAPSWMVNIVNLSDFLAEQRLFHVISLNLL